MATRVVQMDWQDITGLVRSTRVYAATNPCSVMTQLLALSNAYILRNFDSTVDLPIGSANATVYQSVADIVGVQYTLSSGDTLVLLLPAPAASIFMPDGKTVDPASLTALNAAVIGNASDASGNVATAFIGGRLWPSNTFGLTPIG